MKNEFRKGVKAAFNYILCAACNTDDETRAVTLCDMASDMLEELDEDSAAEWKKINELSEIIRNKEEKIEQLKVQRDSAITYIENTPCDPDIFPEQEEAWNAFTKHCKGLYYN